MGLEFRNINVDPSDPVDQWGVEGIVAAIERGGLVHLRRIADAALSDPQGPVAQDLAEAVEILDNDEAVGAAKARLLGSLLNRARDPRAEVAHRVQAAINRSGMSLRDFAAAVGTSAPRLSTYARGTTMPSAAKLVQIERVRRQ